MSSQSVVSPCPGIVLLSRVLLLAGVASALAASPLQAQKPAPAGQPEGWGSTWTATPAASRSSEPVEVRVFNERYTAALRTGDFSTVLAFCQEQQTAHPSSSTPRAMRGFAYLGMKRYQDALSELQEAVRLSEEAHEPTTSVANMLYMRASAQTHLKEYRGAIASVERAHKLAPNDLPILNRLAWDRATAVDPALRDGREAVRLAKRMAEVGILDPSEYDTVAAAFAEVGDFPRAIEAQKTAIAMTQKISTLTPKQAKFLAGANARLDLYNHAKPYRDEHLPDA